MSAQKIDEYTRTLCDVAWDIPPLETIYTWRPRWTGNIEWAPFEVVRRVDGSAKDDVEIRCPEDVRKYGGPRYPAVPMIDQYGVDLEAVARPCVQPILRTAVTIPQRSVVAPQDCFSYSAGFWTRCA